MAKITTLKKNGQLIKTYTKQSVSEIWELMTGTYEPNMDKIPSNRDYMILLDPKDNPVIINKRYIFRIDED